MKNLKLNKLNALAVCAVLAFSSAALLAQDPAQAGNGPRTDGQIEMDVVQALDASQALKNDLITAATIQTQVTLSGTVANDADKQLAESIVKKVPGVTGVKNNLKVGNPTDDASAQAPDDNTVRLLPAIRPTTSGYGQRPGPSSRRRIRVTRRPEPDRARQSAASAIGRSLAMASSTELPPQQPSTASNRATVTAAGIRPAAATSASSGVRPPSPILLRLRLPSYSIPKDPSRWPREPCSSSAPLIRSTASAPRRALRLDFTVIRDVTVNGWLAIPRGATVHGVITQARMRVNLPASPELALQLTSLDMGGRNYPLDSDQFRVKGPSKTGQPR